MKVRIQIKFKIMPFLSIKKSFHNYKFLKTFYFFFLFFLYFLLFIGGIVDLQRCFSF